MTEKFTPGPWKSRPGNTTVLDKKDRPIAMVYRAEYYRPKEESFANVALIKAAPEMVEILDEVGSDLAVAFASTPGIESKIWQDILKEDIQKICAVLKKVRGEEL